MAMFRFGLKEWISDYRDVLRPVGLFFALAAIPVGIWAMIDSREDSTLADLTAQVVRRPGQGKDSERGAPA